MITVRTYVSRLNKPRPIMKQHGTSDRSVISCGTSKPSLGPHSPQPCLQPSSTYLLAYPFSSFIYFAVVVSVMMVLLWRRQRKLVSTGVESACSSTFTSCRHPIFLLLARARCGRSVFSTIVSYNIIMHSTDNTIIMRGKGKIFMGKQTSTTSTV